MNSKKALTLLIAVCLLVIVGCQKKTEPVAPPTEPTAAAAEIEQKICPVMEAPIDKNIFVEFQGKKVYFCCSQCKGNFEKNPEKYLPKLPQFKK
jgi:YHS domain-containing protein